ncbi:MAG: hypothetical protein LOD91_03770 [Limnochordales bacterium]|nr:hypothetical protein [Limnochordales bacterium]
MNDELRRKVRVLQQLSVAAYPDAMLIYLCGLLMGAVHRVHFVRHLEGAPIAIQIAMGRARVWPTPPWQATVGGMSIPDPLTLASALAQRDDPICVKLMFDGSNEHEDFQRSLVDSYADIVAGRTAGVQEAEDRMAELRARIDRALDIYNECRRMMEEGTPERQAELAAFQRMAQEELQACTRELRQLEMQLANQKD